LEDFFRLGIGDAAGDADSRLVGVSAHVSFFGFVDALVLGVIAGVFEAIPYLGPILSAVPALLFAMGEGGMTPVWVLFAYLTVQVLENNVICP